MDKIKSEKITLLWTCPICGDNFQQALISIVKSGTAVCPNCDCDCILDNYVELEDVERAVYKDDM